MEGNLMRQDRPVSPNPLGSEGRDGAFDFARRAGLDEAGERATPPIEDILAELPAQFRAAVMAEAAFSKWRSAGNHSIAALAARLREVIEAGQPYAHSYQTIELNFPSYLDQAHDRLRAELSQDGSNPGELMEGEGSPGLTLAGGGGHA
jgi:hypothetical protein